MKVNFTEYKQILEAERVSIHDLLTHFKKDNMDYDQWGNIYVNFNKDTKGTPIMVAHTDNVLHGERKPVLTLDGKRIFGGNGVGIGFDDKAGIIGAIEIWKRMKKKGMRLIFTADEEVGGIGASHVPLERIEDAAYIVELDRRGSNDLIQTSGYTRLASDEFAKIWEDLGFKKATGTFTATAIAHNGARKSVTVKVIEKYPQSLTATCDTAYTLLEGKTVQLGVEASEAMIVNVTWSSSDKTVAKVTQKGKVTAKGTGKATITASAEGGASVKFKITVNPNTEEMVLWAESIAQNDKYGYSMGTTRGKEGSGSKKLNRYCGICHKWDSRDYDCASFVCAALAHGYKDPAFIEYCGNYGIGGCRDLYNKLLKAGWEDKGNLKEGKLKRGDILINPGAHVEIYYGEGMTVGAHDNYDGKKGDGSGREIRVGDIYGHFWNHVLRKPSN